MLRANGEGCHEIRKYYIFQLLGSFSTCIFLMLHFFLQALILYTHYFLRFMFFRRYVFFFATTARWRLGKGDFLFPCQLKLKKKTSSTQLCNLSIQTIHEKVKSNRSRLFKKKCCKGIHCTPLLRHEQPEQLLFWIFFTICHIPEWILFASHAYPS